MSNRSKKRFRRYDSHKKKRLSNSWRRPRGLHNKMRRHIAAKGRMVKSGYGSPRETRGRHPCGLYETLVYNVNNLSTVEGKAIRIASSVGKRKRMEIRKRAEEMGLKVLN